MHRPLIAGATLVGALIVTAALVGGPYITQAETSVLLTQTPSQIPLGAYLPLMERPGETATPTTGPGTPTAEPATPTSTATTGPGTPTTTPTTPTSTPSATPSATPSTTPAPAPDTTLLFAWETKKPIAMARSEAQGNAVGGKLYVFGGFYNGRLQTTDKAEVYDPATNTWAPIADMPLPLTHSPSVTDGRFIYFVGGFVGDHPGNSTNQVWRYDTQGNSWQQMPSLPEPLGAGGAVVLGRTLHTFGGTNRQNGHYSDKASHYVLDLDGGTSWQSLAPLPTARNHMGGTLLNGKIYAIGGQKAGNEGTENQAEVDVYDPASNTWSRAADMPIPRGHITASVIPYQGRIIILGGSLDNGGGGRRSADVLMYDPGSDSWTKLPSLPEAHKTPVADIIGDRLYVTTGAGPNVTSVLWSARLPGTWEQWPAAPVALGEVAGGIVGNELYLVGDGNNATLAYNLAQGTWRSDLAQRTFPGDHQAAEVYGGKLYVFGGFGGGSGGKLQIYNPATNSWGAGADMPFGAGSSASAVIGGEIYVAGGITGSTTTNAAAKYNPATNTWAMLAPMPQGRNHAASATDGSKLYVFGGRGPGSGDGNTVANGFNTVQIYDPATNTWVSSQDAGSTLAPLPQARGGMGKAVFWNGEFYVIGGETENGAGATSKRVYDRVDIYNPATNSWRRGTPMPTARHGIFPLLRAGRIYVAAGGTQAANSESALLEVYNPQ